MDRNLVSGTPLFQLAGNFHCNIFLFVGKIPGGLPNNFALLTETPYGQLTGRWKAN